MVDLHRWVVNKLLFLWVELCSKERIVVSFHGGNKDLSLVVIAYRGWLEHSFQTSIALILVRCDTTVMMVICKIFVR